MRKDVDQFSSFLIEPVYRSPCQFELIPGGRGSESFDGLDTAVTGNPDVPLGRTGSIALQFVEITHGITRTGR
jgi:hypothetical protein